MAGALLLGGSLVVLSLSRSIWLGAFIFAVPLSAGLLGAGTLTVTVLIARWTRPLAPMAGRPPVPVPHPPLAGSQASA